MDVVHVLHQSSGLKTEGRHPESRRNPETKKTHTLVTPVNTLSNSMTIAGGAVSYSPTPTPEPSTTSRTGRGEKLHTGRWKPGEVIGRQSAGGVLLTDNGRPDAAGGDGD